MSSMVSTVLADVKSGLVVFFLALPLCLGIALASGAPLVSGLLAGIVGGLVVGMFSGSHTSVSGPAAGLSAVVAAQIFSLGSFSAFLMAVILAGAIQIALGLAKGGFISEFFPSSVIKGLLAAIGVIIIFKQIPHLVGHDADPEGDLSFSQPDLETTFSELFRMFGDYQLGAAVVGLLSVALLVLWDSWKPLKTSLFPAPVAVVLFGIGGGLWFEHLGDPWVIKPSHLVQVPVAGDLAELFGLFAQPDFSQWMNPAVYTAGMTLALVASLETLLNLNATDRLDPQQRTSPPNQELLAQGIGNVACGLVGGLPVTSVIIRSSVNVNAGGRTKTGHHHSRHLAPYQCPAHSDLVEYHSAIVPRGYFVDGRYQTGQSSSHQANVERGPIPIYSVRGNCAGDCLHGSFGRHRDRIGRGHWVYSE